MVQDVVLEVCCVVDWMLICWYSKGYEVRSAYSLYKHWSCFPTRRSDILDCQAGTRTIKDSHYFAFVCGIPDAQLYLHEASLDQQIDSSMVTEITWATRCTVQTIQPRNEVRERSWQAHSCKCNEIGRPRLNSTSSSHSCQTASCSGWEHDLIVIDSVVPFK